MASPFGQVTDALNARFRTYFPDAYKQHYPNARTHLSSKVRSTLPDGSSLFEKTRSKKRRPFTEEEDRALKAGYDKHGTVWAVIVKDPIFQEQGRRSTDLRDRFRNAFPDLYTAAGYKPRGNPKKKVVESSGTAIAKSPMRAATDDQLDLSTGNTQQRKKRRYTSQGLLRGGTKSVPQSAAPSDNEASDGEQESGPSRSSFSTGLVPPYRRPTSAVPTPTLFPDDMNMLDPHSDPISLNSSTHSEIDSQSQAWSSGLDTPLHSSHHAWTGSPTSSNDFYMNASPSPFDRRDGPNIGGMGMIGNSAWGTQDWFSANPRLDSSGSSSSYIDNSFSPSSPFSFHQSHGVVDRYDLVPSSFSQDFNSEVGSSSFSDEIYHPRREYHSDYAGDLIFGTRSQSQSLFYDSSSLSFGLGLTGMQAHQPSQASIHPMALHSSSLPGIDEVDLTGITLSDQPDGSQESMISSDVAMSPSLKDDDGHEASFLLEQRFSLDDLVDLSQELHATPPATPQTRPRRLHHLHSYPMSHGRSISVPPAERMATNSSRPSQIHANSQPEIRPYSFADAHHTQSDIDIHSNPPSAFTLPVTQSFSSLFHTNTQSLPHTGPSSVMQDMSRTASEISALPFLDLHYYGSGAGVNGMDAEEADVNRQGQALDLASTVSGGGGMNMAGWKAAGDTRRVAVSVAPGRTMLQRERGGHQRGQSAVVCPQDLIRSDTNKRKRVSWDGAHS